MSEPDRVSIRTRCGSCEKSASQTVVAKYNHTVGQEHEIAGRHFYDEQDWLLRLSLCSSCDVVNLSVEDDGGEITVLYPKPPAEFEGLPKEIARAYKAARAVRLIDANAFAVLIGRVLELVCLDRNAVGKDLFEQLRDLAARGEMPGPLAGMANQLRILRNIGAHASLGELTRNEVPILDDLCGAVLEYVYIAPSRVADVQERIAELVKRKKVKSEGSVSEE